MPIFEVPYLYRAKVTLPRKRNESLVLVRDTVPVRVDEIPEESAPVAVERLDDAGTNVAARYRSGGDGLLEPHLVETRLRTGGTGMRPIGLATLENWFRQGIGKGIFQEDDFGDVRPLEGDERATVLGSPGEARACSWDDKLTSRAAVVRRSRKAMMVGDRLHFASTGPVAYLVPCSVSREILVEWASNADSVGDECWRCDRVGDALDAARAAAAGRGWRDVREVGGVRVLSAASVTWDDDFANLGTAASDLISETGWRLQAWPTAAIIAWTRLRDALVTWPAAREPGHVEVARDALREITARGLHAFGHERRRDWDPTHMHRALQRCDTSGPATVAKPAP
jgi:hypothetical protein